MTKKKHIIKASVLLSEAKLRLARTNPSNQGKVFICYALNDVCFDSVHNLDWGVCGRVKAIIHDRLGKHSCLEEWLRYKQKITRKSTGLNEIQFKNKVQELRHAWIDSLIAEFKAKGD